MENLIMTADYAKLKKCTFGAFFAKVDEKKQAFLNLHVDIRDYVCTYLVERLREFTNGCTSYYDKSAKELQSYVSHYTNQYFHIDACEAFCKTIYNFTTNYKLEIISEYTGDSSDRRTYNGTKFEADCIAAFKKVNTHDLTKLINIEKHNLFALVIYYASRYMTRNKFDDINDLQNHLVMFTGETYKKAELAPWIAWLEGSTSENIALSMASVEDYAFSDEYNDAQAKYDVMCGLDDDE